LNPEQTHSPLILFTSIHQLGYQKLPEIICIAVIIPISNSCKHWLSTDFHTNNVMAIFKTMKPLAVKHVILCHYSFPVSFSAFILNIGPLIKKPALLWP